MGGGRKEKSRKDKKRMEKINHGRNRKEREDSGKARREKGKEREDGMVLLVRTVNAKPIESEGKEEYCRIMEFHLVDLTNKKLVSNQIPSLTPCDGVGDGGAALFDASLFLLGGIFGVDDDGDDADDDGSNSSSTSQGVYKGGSRFSFVSKTWTPVQVPNNSGTTNPAVVANTIYCFGGCYLRPEFFIPPDDGGFWMELYLPSHLQGRFVSFPVLPDPTNSRILVHVPDLRHLYAYYPPMQGKDGVWRLLDSNFRVWSLVTALADDILYFHTAYDSPLISAYHIPSGKWFDKVVSDFSRLDNITICYAYEGIFSFGLQGLMCLATWLPCHQDDSVALHFLIFKVEPTLEPDFELKVTALDYQTYSIPSTYSVYDFLVLPPKFSY